MNDHVGSRTNIHISTEGRVLEKDGREKGRTHKPRGVRIIKEWCFLCNASHPYHRPGKRL